MFKDEKLQLAVQYMYNSFLVFFFVFFFGGRGVFFAFYFFGAQGEIFSMSLNIFGRFIFSIICKSTGLPIQETNLHP